MEQHVQPLPAAAQGTAAPPLIEMEGVARRYDMCEVTVTALEEVDLRVDRGEFVVVLGPSGSGKTTLLNLIGALDTPTEGAIRILGEDITGASRSELFAFRRRTVSFIFQTFNLFPALTALENVEFGADVSGRGNGRELAAETLAKVGLGARGGHFPHELSGGEQQRVAIARALATRNPILLADEPTGELDQATGAQVAGLLERVNADGTALVVVTHDTAFARRARRIVSMRDGLLVGEETPR